MPMRPETRKKISDALKGRRKSAEHRESLRRRFEGSQNPMYGRKRSAESRAKISRAMSAKAKQKKSEQPQKPPVQEEAIDQLREKAMESRLITSVTTQPEKRVRKRVVHDEIEAAHVDRILKRVAKLEKPPESVVRTLNSNREKRLRRANQRRIANNSKELVVDEKTSQVSHPQPDAKTKSKTSPAKNKSIAKCSVCNGTGLMQCPRCITSGISSSRCQLCYGAGGVFCDTCNGVGVVL
ncbi:Heat shock protein DnaJ cysteine-rich [Gracilaria domingensis]|nr:Heat shock protein DnaJ cysteine-rich [Gracilaria domingensis]